MQKFKKYLNVELVDDPSDFGGVSYQGETLEDFLKELFKDYEIETLTDDKVNMILTECGIEPIKF